MIFFGTKFWAWGNVLTPDVWNCSKCGHQGPFIQKKGMNFLTLYFILPIIPLSKMKNIAQCPNCKAQYENDAPHAGNGGNGAPPSSGSNPYGGPFSN